MPEVVNAAVIGVVAESIAGETRVAATPETVRRLIGLGYRLADGWDGAMFLQDVKTLLEDPTTMLMEMI